MATKGILAPPSRATSREHNAASPEFLSAFQALVGEVFRLNGSLLAAGERLGRDLGISPARWQAIAVIRHEPMTVANMARQLGLTRQSVQRTVNGLIRDGLAQTGPNPVHKRSHWVELTAQGRQVMTQLRERQVPLTTLFTDALDIDSSELEQIAQRLKAIRETAEKVATTSK